MADPTLDYILGDMLMHDHVAADLPPALGALAVANTEDINLTLTGSELTADLADNPTANNITINEYFYFER